MSTTPTPTAGSTAQSPSRSRLLWILGLIVVVAIAAVGLWFLFGDEGEPTATFDGQAATYSGPTSVAAGEITFTFDATEYDNPIGVMFLVAEVTDDSVTLEEIEALAAAQPASGPIPPFIGRFESQLVMDEVLEETYTLSEGRWMVSANTSPQDTDRVYPATILEVTGG